VLYGGIAYAEGGLFNPGAAVIYLFGATVLGAAHLLMLLLHFGGK